MCTALSLNTVNHYLGRTLDLDRSYGEEVVIMPRRCPIEFRFKGRSADHYAMIGMATVVGGVPLFYDAVNEKGLSIAGLNFPENAHYFDPAEGKDNVGSFEFIPWILAQCASLSEARALLIRVNITNISFSEGLPYQPLHWMITDKTGSLVVESRRDGLHVHDNPVGVMANNPPFEYHLSELEKYRGLRTDNALVKRSEELPYSDYCQGLGAVGLPGDVSSKSRFVRAAFGRENSVCGGDENSSVGQFFHVLGSVEMIRGVCKTDHGTIDITGYTSCMNLDKGIYYYTTYGNRQISCVNMYSEDLGRSDIIRFPLKLSESIYFQN